MKKILWAAMVCWLAVPMTAAWSQAAPAKEKPQWVLDHEKDFAQGRTHKKTKPQRKVTGTAKRGAKQVSPLVVKK
jgi:hypothetical protein